MKKKIWILIIFILFNIYNYSTFAISTKNLNTNYINTKVNDIWNKIFLLSKKRNISVQNIEVIINRRLAEKEFSIWVKTLIKEIFIYAKKLELDESIKENEPQINKINDYLLYPYYKNTYLAWKSNELLQRNIFKIDTEEKTVYLTFDDWPSNKPILNVLKDNEVNATFFLICKNITQNNIFDYKNELFSIWAHTFSHSNYDNLTYSELSNDIEKCKNIFTKNNLKLDKFRPAFWIINENELDILEENNIKNYLWNIDSLDWDSWFSMERVELIIENINWWDIILFHENV